MELYAPGSPLWNDRTRALSRSRELSRWRSMLRAIRHLLHTRSLRACLAARVHTAALGTYRTKGGRTIARAGGSAWSVVTSHRSGHTSPSCKRRPRSVVVPSFHVHENVADGGIADVVQ